MKKKSKPYYEINCNSYCKTEIYVNNVLITEFKGKQTEGGVRQTGFFPINQVLLRSGKYEVVGKMYPRYGETNLTEENAYLGIDFYCSEADDMKHTKGIFHPKIESPWDGLSEHINYPTFQIMTVIDVDLPYILDGWQNSVDLKKLDEKKIFQEILEYYTNIQATLKNHDVTKFLELSNDKMKLQEQAFYFDEERKKSIQNSLKDLFSRNLDIEPIDEKKLNLEIMGYGKLVRLVNENGQSPIQFKSPNIQDQDNIEFDIKLHMRTKEKGFSII